MGRRTAPAGLRRKRGPALVWRCREVSYICRPNSRGGLSGRWVKDVLSLAVRANVAQLVEQLICNQQVGGSNPSIGSVNGTGEIPKWPTGADCKSAASQLRRFESCSPHHSLTEPRSPVRPIDRPSFQAGVAQLVEHQPSKLNVAGSSLVSRSSTTRGGPGAARSRSASHQNIGLCSSGVEHFLGKEEVTGSIPVKGSAGPAAAPSRHKRGGTCDR